MLSYSTMLQEPIVTKKITKMEQDQNQVDEMTNLVTWLIDKTMEGEFQWHEVKLAGREHHYTFGLKNGEKWSGEFFDEHGKERIILDQPSKKVGIGEVKDRSAIVLDYRGGFVDLEFEMLHDEIQKQIKFKVT